MKKIKKASEDALIIVAVDKMINLKAYFDALQDGKDVTTFFGGTPEEYCWYYKAIGNILTSTLGNHKIIKDYNKLLRVAIEKQRSVIFI